MKQREQGVPFKTKSKIAGAACVIAMAALFSVETANTASDDLVVEISEAQTVKQVVENELNSSRFADQIAAYNGIESISTILPVGASLQIPRPYFDGSNFGRVAFVKGSVVHTQRDLVVNPPSKGSMVFRGDIFTTGPDGFISLNFNSGASINLQPDSRVSVVNLDCIDETVKCVIALNADRGEIQSDITPRPDGQPPVQFSVDTPFLSAAVRGTAFYVNVEEGADRIGVTQGSVAAAAGNADNELARGEGLLAAAGVEPSVVDLLTPPEVLFETDALISTEDLLSWVPIDEANQYRFTVASDEALTQPISVQRLQGNSLSPELSAPGDYYVSVSGIDAGEFIGLATTQRIKYASIDDDERVELRLERSGDRVNITVPDYEGNLELQISNSLDGNVVDRMTINDPSDGISLELEREKDWFFQARKLFGEYSVSGYSNQYFLEAIE